MAYIVPQVLVYQEFQLVVGAITQPLRACLVGPVYEPLIRFTDPDEKSKGYLTKYEDVIVPQNEDYDEFSWPNLGSSVVDQEFTKLTAEGAFVRYHTDSGGSSTFNGSREVLFADYDDSIENAANTGGAIVGNIATNVFTADAPAGGNTSFDWDAGADALISGVDGDLVVIYSGGSIVSCHYITSASDTTITLDTVPDAAVDVVGVTIQIWRSTGVSTGGYKNRVRFATELWAGLDSAGTDTTQAPYNLPARDRFGTSRDVQPGDYVTLAKTVGVEAQTLTTYITDLVPDIVPSNFSNPTEGAGNQGTVVAQLPTAVQTEASGVLIDVPGTDIDDTLYDGRADGNIIEVYTIEVIRGGSGANALLRVRSASGNDDQASVQPAINGDPTAIGTRGLTVTFGLTATSADSFELGSIYVVTVVQAFVAQTIDLSAASLLAGAYTGAQNTVYTITVVRGGDTTNPQNLPVLEVTTSNGYDSEAPSEIAGFTDVVSGSYDLKVDFGAAESFCAGDSFTVTAAAPSDGPVRTLVLAKNVPDAWLSADESAKPDIDVTFYVKTTVDIPENRLSSPPIKNWDGATTAIGINENAEVYLPDFWNADSNEQLALPIISGDIYVTYRGISQSNLRTVTTISDVSEIQDAVGVLDIDQPMAVALEKAIANASGTPVKFLPVRANTKEGYADALEVLVGTEEVYSLVPLTWDREIQNLFAAHVETMSSPENGRWRITFVSTQARTETAVATSYESGSSLEATVVDDPVDQAQQYTLLEVVPAVQTGDTDVDFNDTVVPGDIVRINYDSDGFGNFSYDSYEVAAVISANTLRLVAPGLPGEELTPVKIEIWRTFTTNEVAQDLGTQAGSFFSRRVYNVWPDYIGSAGINYDGYIAAAAVAGQVSGVVPHQGHTNLELLGFDDVSRTTEEFNTTQLNTMAAAGVYIITQDQQTGKVYTRHELSTNSTDVNTRELMVTKNVDAMSYLFLETLKPFIGISNITPTLIDQVDAEIQSQVTYLKTNGFVARLGSQLIDGVVTKLEQHPTLKDRLVVELQITIPYPLNNIELHLVVPA